MNGNVNLEMVEAEESENSMGTPGMLVTTDLLDDSISQIDSGFMHQKILDGCQVPAHSLGLASRHKLKHLIPVHSSHDLKVTYEGQGQLFEGCQATVQVEFG
ncbi:hypothetical protein IMY05_002G0058800 [Salix suchowensis]|nr:hypothetical protein IMY05_002G0058800 [Salix suchowensis]